MGVNKEQDKFATTDDIILIENVEIDDNKNVAANYNHIFNSEEKEQEVDEEINENSMNNADSNTCNSNSTTTTITSNDTDIPITSLLGYSNNNIIEEIKVSHAEQHIVNNNNGNDGNDSNKNNNKFNGSIIKDSSTTIPQQEGDDDDKYDNKKMEEKKPFFLSKMIHNFLAGVTNDAMYNNHKKKLNRKNIK